MDARTVTSVASAASTMPSEPAGLDCAVAATQFGLNFTPSPHWKELDPELHSLTSVVRHTSEELERTTVLTWLYRNRGFLTFLEIVSRVDGQATQTVKKRRVRRMLRNMVKIGVIALYVEAPKDSLTLEIEPGDLDSDLEEGDVQVGAYTCVHITELGMTWMRRAYRARSASIQSGGTSLDWVHRVHLEEEEDGKGTEPYWVETMGNVDGSRPSLSPTGQESSWISQRVTSVFDLATVIHEKSPTGRRRS